MIMIQFMTIASYFTFFIVSSVPGEAAVFRYAPDTVLSQIYNLPLVYFYFLY